MTDETQTPKQRFVVTIATNLIAIYFFIAFFIATPYYNWQYANQNGFFQWLLLGEFIPTGKAMIWPYFWYTDSVASRTEADENRKLKAYLQAILPLMKEREMLDYETVKATGKIEELMKTDRKAAQKFAADVFIKTTDKNVELLARMEHLTPPNSLRELHDVNVSGKRDEIPLLREVATALLSSDERKFNSAYAHLASYDAEWVKRRDAVTAKLNDSAH